MEEFNSYYIVIGASVVIIISYLFGLIAKRTNVPSVLMLLLLGYLAEQVFNIPLNGDQWFLPLELLGVIGLILIVLEAALDLELKRENWQLIWKSTVIAASSLLFNSFFLAFGIMHFIGNMDLITGLIYAIPLSITSSAIVIPSVSFLDKPKKEFLIYESTISDILGIMFFYLLVENLEVSNAVNVSFIVLLNVAGTLILSVVLSYAMIIFFQKIRSEVKLFLFFAVLVLLYALGKIFHLSSLLMILVFGLVLENRLLFFRGFMRKYLDEAIVSRVLVDFKLLTRESAFVVRTFFFVVLGMSITLAGLMEPHIIGLSLFFIIGLFGFRYMVYRILVKKDIFPQVFVSPRGLISILLFLAIPKEFRINDFEVGILVLSIIATSILMAWALVHYRLGKLGRLKRYLKLKQSLSVKDKN
jgi:NhaP-type Na+/H+ or K+/H+ antiporter